IFLYAALKRNPESGPTLTHISASHVWGNVKLSVQTTFGSIFRNQIDFLLQSVTAHDRAIAWIAAGGFVLVCAAVLGRELRTQPSEAPAGNSSHATGFKRSIGLTAVGI